MFCVMRVLKTSLPIYAWNPLWVWPQRQAGCLPDSAVKEKHCLPWVWQSD